MRVIVVGGIPGSGKSYLTTRQYQNLPILDMMTLRKKAEQRLTQATNSYYTWLESMRELVDQLDELEKAGTTTVIVEGIFWPGSASLNMLRNECVVQGYELEEVHLEVPGNVAVRRVLEDYERDLDDQRFYGRLYLIGKYLGGYK